VRKRREPQESFLSHAREAILRRFFRRRAQTTHPHQTSPLHRAVAPPQTTAPPLRALRRLGPAALLVACSLVIIVPRFQPLTPGNGDPWGYFDYLPALFRGEPFVLRDWAALYPRIAHWPPTGRPVTQFGLGPAIFWLPAYAIARLIYPHSSLTSQEMWTACGIATIIITLAGLLFLFAALSALMPRWAAWLAAFASLTATPLLAYCTKEPYMAHATGFALSAALLWLLLARLNTPLPARRRAPFRRCGNAASKQRPGEGDLAPQQQSQNASLATWAAMGVIIGLLADGRPQLILLALLPLIVGRPNLRRLAVFAAAVFIAALPQMIFWRMTFGRWLVMPQSTIRSIYIQPLTATRAWLTLFSWRHGLFSWHPIVGLAFIALIAAARMPQLRRFVAATILVFILQLMVNAMAKDWWGGGSFGSRRFIEVLPMFAVGLGLAMARFKSLALLLIPASLWNLGLLWAQRWPLPPRTAFILHPAEPLTAPIARQILAYLASPITDLAARAGLAGSRLGEFALALAVVAGACLVVLLAWKIGTVTYFRRRGDHGGDRRDAQ
jgi:hypothetical protein